MRAGHLVAQVHPAAERPADLELAHGPRLESDEGDGVVLVVDRVHERVGVAHDLDRPVPLSDEVANDLDAVAAEVDDGPATGEPPIPEPGGVRPGMGFARADPGDVAQCSILDRLEGLERLRRVAQVLEIATEDTGLLDRLQDLLSLLGIASEWLGAQHRLTGRRCRRHRLHVEVVRQSDDHDVRVPMVDGRLEVGRVLRDPPPLAECGPARLGPGVDDLDPVAPALAVQRGGVEVTDQTGAEHRDPVGAHRSGVPPGATDEGGVIDSSRADAGIGIDRGSGRV